MKTTTAVLLVAGLVGLIYITRKKKTATAVTAPKKSGQSSIKINVMWNPVESQWQEPWTGPTPSTVVYPPKF